jgi:hypothetical protein
MNVFIERFWYPKSSSLPHVLTAPTSAEANIGPSCSAVIRCDLPLDAQVFVWGFLAVYQDRHLVTKYKEPPSGGSSIVDGKSFQGGGRKGPVQ